MIEHPVRPKLVIDSSNRNSLGMDVPPDDNRPGPVDFDDQITVRREKVGTRACDRSDVRSNRNFVSLSRAVLPFLQRQHSVDVGCHVEFEHS